MKSESLAALDRLRGVLMSGTPRELDRHEASLIIGAFFAAAPAIGIDLDGCIDEAPEWFRVLSRIWPGRVYVITYRTDVEKARRDIERFGVHCDEIILVNRFDAKAEVIAKKGISVYFDDQDEMLLHIPEGVTVLKIRNGGNYDFEDRKWIFSSTTGRTI